jgi:hypothetical protein
VCVVEEPVNGRSREGLGHELVEAGWVQVRRLSDVTTNLTGVSAHT